MLFIILGKPHTKSKTLKATDFEFDTHVSRNIPYIILRP